MSYREESYYRSKYNQIATKGINLSEYSLEELKALWHKTLKEGFHGICFSMYMDGQSPGDEISLEQVEHRIKILKPYVGAIRSFSCIEGNEFVPIMAKKHGLKTLVGAWLSDDKEDNEREIEGLIALAKAGNVDVAAVGNEVLYRNDLTLDELVGYINRAAQGKPIIITETGWPSQGGGLKGAVAAEDAAMKYFIDTVRWTKENEIPVFYFSSFDESWKTGDEGDVGAYWGLWDKHENLKF